MGITTIIGLISCFVLVVWGMSLGGDISIFFDLPSILITGGGTLGALLTSFSLQQFAGSVKVAMNAFTNKAIDSHSIIQTIVSFAEKARREGLLALEDAAEQLDDDFFKKGIQLVVDGTDPQLVRSILEIELAFIEERHKEGKYFFEQGAQFAPAFGMLGTLIGLIKMLRNLNKPELIGPGMAVALITTFYGSVIANMICLPIANKLSRCHGQEMLIKQIVIEGVLSIQAGENPRIIK